jgi:carbamoyltransferase
VLAERASEFFDMKGESPFMLFAVPVRKEKAAVIPAVVHVDGSARPQTVTAAQNPRMHALISAFARRTGVPIVMNTSFNGAGEPVVCAPADAIKTFLASGMNVLALGDYVVTRADSPA